jgi:hypothetical protein
MFGWVAVEFGAWWGSEDAAGWGGDFEGLFGGEFCVPAGLVQEGVVAGA